MTWKRPMFLISGTVIGTVGVLSYAPPSPPKSSLLSLLPATASSTQPSQPAPTTAPPSSQNTPSTQTAPATTPTTAPAKATTKKSSTTTAKSVKKKKRTAKPASQTPTLTKTQTSTATRTIAGSTIQTPFGPVQVQITVQGTKIINAAALQTPQGGRSSWINNQAVPYLIQETLAAQSANIQGVGGATYTSQSWAMSLQAAIGKI